MINTNCREFSDVMDLGQKVGGGKRQRRGRGGREGAGKERERTHFNVIIVECTRNALQFSLSP